MAGTSESPYVCLDKRSGKFEISGRALVEKAPAFYKPALDWLRAYSQAPNAVTEFVFKLEYINTGSSKVILDILGILDRVPGAKVVWCFREDDEDMEEVGEEFSELAKVPFEFRLY